MTVSEARAAFAEILDLVGRGEEVTLTRHGQPVAVIVRPDSLRSRRADAALAGAEQLRQLIERARLAPLPAPAMDADRAEEHIASLRRDRAVR
jgi:prevent-host-death family protein